MKTLLCLHGYAQNEKNFRKQLSPLIAQLGDSFDFVIPDAPVIVPWEEVKKVWKFIGYKPGKTFKPAVSEANFRAWFRAEGANWKHWSESEQLLGQLINSHKPVAIIGYSQGFQSLMRLLAEVDTSTLKIPGLRSCRCVVALSSPHTNWYQQQHPTLKFELPSIHGFGTECPMLEKYHALLAQFKSPEVITYPGGHSTPKQNGTFWQSIAEFISVHT